MRSRKDYQFRAAGLEVNRVSSIASSNSFVAGMVLSLQQEKESS
jgi:fructose-1-phosphate kinase PfkB-like protein